MPLHVAAQAAFLALAEPAGDARTEYGALDINGRQRAEALVDALLVVLLPLDGLQLRVVERRGAACLAGALAASCAATGLAPSLAASCANATV